MLRLASIALVVLLAGLNPTSIVAQPEGMVLIPAGEFEMGDHSDDNLWEALPVHAVYVDSFCMDIFEVTNQRYADALNWAWSQGGLITVTSGRVYKYNSGTEYLYCHTYENTSSSRIHFSGGTFTVTSGKEDHPMVRVSWYGAAAYANWRSGMAGRTPSYDTATWSCDFAANGYRLPTEAEWERAARGGLHSPYRRYPWGDTIDGSKANYWLSGDPYETGDRPWTTPVGYYDGNQTPSGSDMANGYGLYDMGGNVREWCNDWYGPYSDCGPDPCDNPHGPPPSSERGSPVYGGPVLRGGSWLSSELHIRCAARYTWHPYSTGWGYGFRLALDYEPTAPVVSSWGLVVLALGVVGVGAVEIRRQRQAV